MKKVKSYLALIVLALAFAMGASDLQAQGCPGGSGCTACNATVTAVNESFRSVSGSYTTLYMAANKSICGSACSYASGAGSFEWGLMGCSDETIMMQSNGFASIKVINSCAAANSGLMIGFRFKATTSGGATCWSPWRWKTY